MELLDIVLIDIVRVSPLRHCKFCVSESLNKVLSEVLNMGILLFELINGNRIRDCFYEASSWASGYDVEGLQPELKFMRLENSLELLNQLRSKLLLSEIVW